MAQAIELTEAEAREAILKGTCPEGAAVDGGLAFERKGALVELPEALRVRGTLRISGCDRIRRLPAGLDADAVLVEECPVLEGTDPSRGATLTVRRDLSFLNCPSLARFPDRLKVGGSLSMANCPQAWSQPAGRPGGPPEALRTGGDVTLHACAALRHLPDALRVGGSLIILECQSLEALQDGYPGGRWLFGHAVVIRGCHNLRRVGGLRHESAGELQVEHCAALEEIGSDVGPLRVLGLRNCPSLQRLPDNLPDDGWLSARDCPSLRPPTGLAVRAAFKPSGTTPRWTAGGPAKPARQPAP